MTMNNPTNTSANDPVTSVFFNTAGSNHQPMNIPLSVTDGSRNLVQIHHADAQTPPDGSRIQWFGMEYMTVAEHDRQATATAERLTNLLALETHLRGEINSVLADSVSVHQELLTERELRTNAQNERDQYRALLARVLTVDEVCTGQAYAALIAELRGVVEAGA